jgi:putative lipoprotein
MTDIPALSGGFDIVAIDGAAPPAHLTPSIEFADGAAFGQVINRFRGTVTVDGASLTVGPMMSTLMAGPQDAMDAEQRVFAILGAPLTIGADGDDVVLTGAEGSLRLRRPTTEGDIEDAAAAVGGAEPGSRGAAAATGATTLTIAGSVAYRQRIALPPQARTTVSLEDVALADAPAIVLATYVTTGGQVPIPFRLAVALADVAPHARLAVRATIHDGDRLIWTTDTVHSVDPAAGDVEQLMIPLVQVGAEP